ncbi:MAG: iron-sulfur cluster assembly scaffold protein [Candidatus Micrarchaeota archaeon]|nr:iron-sulfur cluster assembly scaffold protein [Candidatus Micrarchaeota archaeon]
MVDESMYRENILDHYKRPRNRGKLAHASCCAEGDNPFCGDEISFCIKAGKGGKLEEVKFDGHACAICVASASILSEEVSGKKLSDARACSKEKLLSLLGIDPDPTRLKCALLPLKVMKLAIYKHLGKKMSKEDEDLV